MERLIAFLIAACLVGCGPATSSQPASNPVAQRPPAPLPPSPKPVVKIESTPTDFSSVDQAIQAMSAAAESDETNARLVATDWLIKHGGASIEPLGQLLENPQTGLKTAIATCRALGKLGPGAAPQLTKGLAKQKPRLLRVNAAEQLGIIDPTNDAIVDRLITLIDDDDQQVRLYAVKALGHIGKPAGKVGPKLQSMLNSLNENDTIRSAAKDALTKVDPRKTFVN